MTCESFSARNKQCMEAFIDYARDRLESRLKKLRSSLSAAELKKARAGGEAALKKAAALMKTGLTGPHFIKLCRIEMKKTTPKALAENQKMMTCFTKTDCREYVNCLLTEKSKGKTP
jgi:hypothetical protein